MRLVIVNPVWEASSATPDETLDRFRSLTGWADAVRSAGASEVTVFQRFHRDAVIDRGGVTYRFVVDGDRPGPPISYGGRALCAAAAREAPGVVHVNGLDHPRLLRGLRRRLPASSVIVVQDHGGFDPMALSAWRRAWMRHGLRAASALLVATPGQKDIFVASGMVPEALDVRDVMEASTSLQVADESSRRPGLSILFVGRLNRNKDPLTVLEGFSRFLTRRQDARLTFVYDDNELEPALRARLDDDAGLRSRVSLLGAVRHEDLPAIYAQADLFVLGSHREGSGYAALEAIACSVIPVLTDIPSFRGMTADGHIGALWRAGEPASLRDALLRVTSSKLAPQREAARAHFDRFLSWPAIGSRAMKIYREFSRM
jgi:glycosyltransferase involved in cell wall biosynthesis